MLEWEKRSQRIDKKILNDHSLKIKWDLLIGEHIFWETFKRHPAAGRLKGTQVKNAPIVSRERYVR